MSPFTQDGSGISNAIFRRDEEVLNENDPKPQLLFNITQETEGNLTCRQQGSPWSDVLQLAGMFTCYLLSGFHTEGVTHWDSPFPLQLHFSSPHTHDVQLERL